VATVTVWSPLVTREGGHETQELREHPVRGGGSLYLSFYFFVARKTLASSGFLTAWEVAQRYFATSEIVV
jgi:hypothetical protein